ncbi:MAG: tyrosine-type recombinase/integrase [Oscillospiraceae bacterium]|nr:tyrosine-type recombinase/integrase [Oscillospiraceae bacterium]
MDYKEQKKSYIKALCENERAAATVEKYSRELDAFLAWLGGNELTKAILIQYKNELKKRFKTSSVNTKLAALNGFMIYIGRGELRVKRLRVQKQLFCEVTKELTKEEYARLVRAAKSEGNERLSLIIQTLCATGIRVSELKWITAQSVTDGRAQVNNKGKTRVILIPAPLRTLLKNYCKKKNIVAGPVFISKNGNPLNRSNIWSDMKKLCALAGVAAQKVFPHNLRRLFARTYYSLEKDLNRLADLLGHSSIETTRIYTMTTAGSVQDRVDRLGLVV